MKIKCPHCGNTDLAHLATIERPTIIRRALSWSDDGALIVAMPADEAPEPDDEPQLMCLAPSDWGDGTAECSELFDVPFGIELDLVDE